MLSCSLLLLNDKHNKTLGFFTNLPFLSLRLKQFQDHVIQSNIAYYFIYISVISIMLIKS